MNTSLIRGRTLTFKNAPKSKSDSNSYQYIEDGALLIKDGKISRSGSFTEIIQVKPSLASSPETLYPDFDLLFI